jgi:hypothetical protein
MMRIFRFAVVVLSLASVCSIVPTSFAQQTLGALNGTVTDPSGASVPSATVTVSNAGINLTRTTTTQDSGFYQIFNLPIGTYTVSVTRDGFDTTDLPAIDVQEARATTVNVSLKVGQTSTEVTVTATPLLNATDTTNGYTLDAQQIALTPLATGSFTQLAVLSPGVNAELLTGLNSNGGLGNQPIWANGQRDTSNTFQVNGVDSTNLFNGKTSSGAVSQRYNFNIGGGSGSSSSTAGSSAIGGANPVGTSVYGSNGNSLPSPPPEFLQEIRVNASMYDAQQGATSGAQIDANTAMGSNNWHGQVYGTFANNALNAAPYFFNQQYQLSTQGVGAFPQSLVNPALHRWTTGGTLGGPILKSKAFFFVAYQHLYNSDQSTGLSQLDVPPLLTNDRSAAGLAAAADISPAKVTPIAQSIFNGTLPDGSFMIPSAQNNQPFQYGVPNVTLFGTSLLTGEQATASVDYNLKPTDQLSVKYYYQTDPVSKPYGVSATAGFPTFQANGSQVAAIGNTISIGPRVNWEQRLGYVRMGSYSRYSQRAINAGGDPNFGVGSGADGYTPSAGLPGILIKEIAANTSVSPGLKLGPYSSFANIGYYQNRLNPSTNVIFAKGRHTIVAGGGYSYTQLNITNNRTGIAQIVSSSFTKFLEDSVHNSSVLNSIDPTTGKNLADRYYRSNEWSGYVQDKWQARPNLTVTGGLRYDYHGGLTEKYGNIFNFDPKTYDVTGDTASGFTVNDSGFVVAANNKYYPTHGVTNSTLSGRQWGLSPRVGFAWQPDWNHGSVVFRGGFGMYFDRGELFSYLSQPAGSSIGGPFGVTESAPLTANVIGTGKTLENPLGTAPTQPQYIPNSNPANITVLLQSTLNGLTGDSAHFGKNCGAIDNQEGYTDCPDTLTFGAYDKNNVLPYTMNFTFNWQWQPTNDLAITIGYTGNRGRHAVIPIPFNEPGIATPSNPINGETATYGFQVLNQNSFTGYDYNAIASEPWNTEDGGNTDFRTPFVGYSPNAAFFKTVGNSAYDGLESHLEKRLSHNFQAGASYTFSHTYDEQSDIGLFFTGDNPNNLRSSYARADFDRTNVFSVNFLVALPNAAAPHSLLSYFTNDWNLTGIAILQNGQPYSLYEFYGAVGSVFFGDYPTLMNPVLPIKTPNNPKLALTGNNGAKRGTGGNYIPAIDPTQINIHYVAPGQMGVPVSTGADPQDIYETDFAPGQRNLFRQAEQKRLDISFRKSFRPTEKMSLQYAFNIFNLTNTTSLDVPQNQTQIRQASACSAEAINEGNNCSPNSYYVNYGQIVTGVGGTNQLSALTNLDQLPYHNGTGKGTTIPTILPTGVQSCTSATVTGGCPNNGANFGSVTGAIGSNRIITMGLNLQF